MDLENDQIYNINVHAFNKVLERFKTEPISDLIDASYENIHGTLFLEAKDHLNHEPFVDSLIYVYSRCFEVLCERGMDMGPVFSWIYLHFRMHRCSRSEERRV